MNKLYLIKEQGKEDYFYIAGSKEGLENLKNSKGETVYVQYPGSDKTVGISFKETDDPEADYKDLIHKNKQTNLIKSIIFICIVSLTVYGGTVLIQQLKASF